MGTGPHASFPDHRSSPRRARHRCLQRHRRGHRRLAAVRGDHVVLLARGADSLERVAVDCATLGAASTLVVPTDMADDSQVAAAVSAAVARHGRLDVVVGSAGVVAYGRIPDVPVDVFDRVVSTNLLGSVNLARHALPVLRGQGGGEGAGSMVLVGSVIGHIAVPDMAAYVVSKWGVRGLVRQLRVDNRDRPGVRLGYVAPGGVDTPIYRQAATYGDSVGRPPFPVSPPETIARRVLAVADHPWRGGQVGRLQRRDPLRLHGAAVGVRPARRPALLRRGAGPRRTRRARSRQRPRLAAGRQRAPRAPGQRPARDRRQPRRGRTPSEGKARECTPSGPGQLAGAPPQIRNIGGSTPGASGGRRAAVPPPSLLRDNRPSTLLARESLSDSTSSGGWQPVHPRSPHCQ